jgi:hypothetical protein
LKSLTPALQAAQRSNSALPYVNAVFDDYWGYARRARFQRFYTGAEPQDPVAAARAPDGSLIRLRRFTQAETLALQVAASADDSYENSGVNSPTEDSPLVDADDEYAGYRFQNVTAPQGATILRAALSIVVGGSNATSPQGLLYGHDTDNAPVFTSGTNNIGGRTPTAATVAVNQTGLPFDGSTFVEIADVTAIVQEIVDRGGWSAGNALALIFQGDPGDHDYDAVQYDEDPAHAARLMITYATGSPQATAYVSRVAAPDAESDFSGWSSLDTEVSALGGIALAVDSDTCYAFMVDDDLTTIVMRTSTDNGASWGARSTVTAAGGVKTHLAAAAADGDIVLFYAELDGTVYAIRWNGSAWASLAAWTNALERIDGLAAIYLLDWQVVVTGQASTTLDRGVWACRYGDGANQTVDTWGPLREVTLAGASSSVWFDAPSIDYADVFRLFFVEHFSGDAPYHRQQWTTMDLSHDFNEEQWREPLAFDYTGEHGVAVTGSSAPELWLASSDGVWYSPLPAFATLDVSASVIAASVRCDGDGALAEIELDNAGGEYTAYGSGNLGALQRGARLQLTPGYRTPDGPEIPGGQPYTYWVEALELITGERPRLKVRARDGWWLLSQWRARRQLAWAAGEKAISQLLLFLMARAGVEYASLSTSDALTALQPAFTVNPGESGVTVVRRLLAMVEDPAFWEGTNLVLTHTAGDDTSTYALGTDHSVIESRYMDIEPDANRARAVGLPGVYAEAIDFTEAIRFERIATAIDLNLTDGEKAAGRAASLLRRSHLGAAVAELKLFGVHCGVELYDVISLTDEQAGLDDALRRVIAYEWELDTRRGRYEMALTLGNV